MGYFKDLAITDRPCLLDEIAALRGEEMEDSAMRGYDTWATQSDEHLLADDDEDALALDAAELWTVADLLDTITTGSFEEDKLVRFAIARIRYVAGRLGGER